MSEEEITTEEAGQAQADDAFFASFTDANTSGQPEHGEPAPDDKREPGQGGGEPDIISTLETDIHEYYAPMLEREEQAKRHAAEELARQKETEERITAKIKQEIAAAGFQSKAGSALDADALAAVQKVMESLPRKFTYNGREVDLDEMDESLPEVSALVSVVAAHVAKSLVPAQQQQAQHPEVQALLSKVRALEEAEIRRQADAQFGNMLNIVKAGGFEHRGCPVPGIQDADEIIQRDDFLDHFKSMSPTVRAAYFSGHPVGLYAAVASYKKAKGLAPAAQKPAGSMRKQQIADDGISGKGQARETRGGKTGDPWWDSFMKG